MTTTLFPPKDPAKWKPSDDLPKPDAGDDLKARCITLGLMACFWKQLRHLLAGNWCLA
jgi:hypothetical protein